MPLPPSGPTRHSRGRPRCGVNLQRRRQPDLADRGPYCRRLEAHHAADRAAHRQQYPPRQRTRIERRRAHRRCRDRRCDAGPRAGRAGACWTKPLASKGIRTTSPHASTVRSSRAPRTRGMSPMPRASSCIRSFGIAVVVPDFLLPTVEARRVLPKTYSRADVIFNIQRSALLITALATGITDAFPTALEDRLHQPYRAPLVPGLDEIIRLAHERTARLRAQRRRSVDSGVLPARLRTRVPVRCSTFSRRMEKTPKSC